MTVIGLYGLAVRSEVPLHQDRVLPPGTVPDIDIDIVAGDEHPRVTDAPAGRVVLHMEAERQYYTAVEDDDGYLLRFYSTCDVRLSRDLARISVHPFPGADPGIVSVLVSGAVLAFVLGVRGEPVLHASAVQVGDRALGFVGASGMGKSTMATLLCADGGRLITDDLLRLDLSQDPPTCFLGATELRLRKAASELSARFTETPGRRLTADARDALAVEPSTTESLPLAGLVVPVPDRTREATAARLDTPDPMTAFLLLSRFPRLLGWVDEDIVARQFQQLGDILDRVPVHVARLPWGPPFPEDLAAAVRVGVGVG